MPPSRVFILALIAGVATPFVLEVVSHPIAVGQAVGWQTAVAMAALTVGASVGAAALGTLAARATIRRKEGRR